MNSMWIVRWVLVALTAVLATILVLRGDVLVGVVLAAIAISRAILFTRLYQRRARFREHIAGRRGLRDF